MSVNFVVPLLLSGSDGNLAVGLGDLVVIRGNYNCNYILDTDCWLVGNYLLKR